MGKTSSKSASDNVSSESDDSADATYNLYGARTTKEGRRTYDYLLKMLVVGESCTGKTCFVNRICGKHEQFSTYIPTIGIDFGIKSVSLNGKRLKAQVWDTSGNKRLRTITMAYFRGSKGIFVLFDVNDESSFYGCNRWLKDIEENAPSNTVILLIGSKCDIREENYDMDNTSYVDYITAKKFADEHQIHYIEISSKDDTNVEFALLTMTRLIMECNRIKIAM